VPSLSAQAGLGESSTPSPPNEIADIQAPSKAMNPDSVIGTGGPPVAVNATTSSMVATPVRHDAAPLTRPQRWAAFVTVNFDMLTYGALFLLVGLPIYYGVGYAMPVQLSLNVVFYFAALRLPPRYKTYLHPVLVSSAFTILGIWVLALIRHNSLRDGLLAYTTSTKYTQLWDNDQGLKPPGAGDMFGSVLDVSIVALSLPMYRYRNELKARFMTIIVPNVIVSIGSLFAYPTFCYHIGISAPRGLAFASRSLTLALATPATKNLGGDPFTIAPLCIFSGIAGVIVGPIGLDLLRIPKGIFSLVHPSYSIVNRLTLLLDDYITRGITLGANSSAVATALLLTTDPRAAAFSSLSMGLLGTITVALTSVPPLVHIIRSLVGIS
jgi:putative effector of murein hydrolase